MKKIILNISQLAGAHKTVMAKIIHPELCKSTTTPPSGTNWLHEMKFDGYRILVFIKNGKIQLISRNEKDWTEKFPEIVKAWQSFSKKNMILDGELVALDHRGISRFQLLQNFMEMNKAAKLAYYAFDILYYDNYDLMRVPLLKRKQLLARVLGKKSKIGILHYSDHILGQGNKIFDKACAGGLEGIISKRIDSFYEQKRTRNWLKTKCLHQQEFVIGGYTEPGGSRKYFGALLLGYYDKNKRLIFSGHVGTGFDQQTLKNLHQKMRMLAQQQSPFYQTPQLKNVHWIKPKLVAEIEFLERTEDGILRQPSFKGLREDKKAKEVRWES